MSQRNPHKNGCQVSDEDSSANKIFNAHLAAEIRSLSTVKTKQTRAGLYSNVYGSLFKTVKIWNQHKCTIMSTQIMNKPLIIFCLFVFVVFCFCF